MRNLKKVIVECNPDELLVLALGLSRKEVVHQNCKGEVCKYHEKEKVRIAIIDEDPGSGQPKYLQKFVIEEERFGIRKLVDRNTGKIILIIQPRLEEWIIAQCTQSNVNPETFFLPPDARRLKDVINLRLLHFSKLLDELKNKESKGLAFLQSFFR